jgi:hypothetical protein
MSAPLFDRVAIQRALEALNEELQRRRVRADIHLVGGAAMLLAYSERPATRDLDGVWEPDTPVREAAWAVAQRLDLPRNWLNNQASVYMSSRATTGRVVFHGSHLRVMVASAEHLLAMKVMASRPANDAEDIGALVAMLGIGEVDEVLDLVHQHFPDDPVPRGHSTSSTTSSLARLRHLQRRRRLLLRPRDLGRPGRGAAAR